MIKTFIEDKSIELYIAENGWTKVFKNKTMIANVISEEEARRVVWLGLIAQGKVIEFVDEDMFEVTNAN